MAAHKIQNLAAYTQRNEEHSYIPSQRYQLRRIIHTVPPLTRSHGEHGPVDGRLVGAPVQVVSELRLLDPVCRVKRTHFHPHVLIVLVKKKEVSQSYEYCTA